VLIDRWPRKPIMLGCTVARGALVALVSVAVALGWLEWRAYGSWRLRSVAAVIEVVSLAGLFGSCLREARKLAA
jgi:hypothetical protein